MNGADDLPDLILVLVIGATILFIGIALLSPVIETTNSGATGGQEIRTAQEFPAGAEQWYAIDNAAGVDQTVYDSRGYAVELTGANDSYIKSTEGVTLSSDETWTLSLWASLNDTSTDQTAIDVDGQILVYYNSSAAEWRAWYYEAGDRDSYEVAVDAPDQPGALTNIQVRSNGTHLSVYRNNTQGETADLTADSIESAPTNSGDLDGRLDEIRGFDDALSSSQRQALIDDPVGPLADTNRTLRVMVDEPYRDNQRIFYETASLEQSNVSYTSGLPGSELEEGRFTALGADYRWSEDGPEIRPLEDGRLGEAPVAYVDYNRTGAVPATLLPAYTAALGLAGLLFLILPLGYILAVVRRPNR